jgi:hypothetical protein
VYTRKLLDVFDEGVSMLISARETGQDKNGGRGVSS